MQVSTIGLDLAKNVFQVHGIDANEKVVVRKQLRRSQLIAFFKALPPCLVGMEACATAHHWARELRKLGHEVRLMPTKDVRAYVKRNKNDAADAEAICEAVRSTHHEIRHGQICRAARAAHAAPGARPVDASAHATDQRPALAYGRARHCQLLKAAKASMASISRAMRAVGSKRYLASASLGATMIAAIVTDPKAFRSGRDFAAWIGLVPRQDATGGKQKLGRTRRPAASSSAPRKVSLAHRPAGTQTIEGRGGGTRQQDGAHCLGPAAKGGTYRPPQLAAAV
jgi:transposase